MPTRRNILKIPASLTVGSVLAACSSETIAAAPQEAPVRPVVLSTWRHGQPANAAAWKILEAGGTALDAVEAGARVTEADPEVHTVGIGSFPDREGVVTLDASIMNSDGDCGSVGNMRDILHPVTVARMVMEKTPHVMLSGAGATNFAVDQGMERVELLTDFGRERLAAWKRDNPGAMPEINVENHDTIGILALDKDGNLSGACTTSGASFKYSGRIGDSPIIGAGLYVDNAIGAATATGWGEAVMRACGSFLVVELMRAGNSPQDACRLAVERVIEKNPDWKSIQVGFIAINKAGETGSYCLQSGFDYALKTEVVDNEMLVPPFKIEANNG